MTLGSRFAFIFATCVVVLAQPAQSADNAGPVVKAVVNGASFAGGGIVPGEIATAFATNLSTTGGINPTSTVPLPTSFQGVSLLINNSRVPIFAVDSGKDQQQINFQVPWELAPGSTATVAISNNGTTGAALTVPVVAVQPGIFGNLVGSDSFGNITHSDSRMVDAGHPAAPGETVVIYCTGLGAISSPPANGAPGSGQPTVATPVVTIGGSSAPVKFSGLAPGFVGLYQVNAVVPSGLEGGNETLVVSMGDSASNPVLLPVELIQVKTTMLPIEVIGPDGTTASVPFIIPDGTNLKGLNLSLRIHGLHSQVQASLQLNGGPWQPITQNTVTLLGLANAYGGIGGGFHTLAMTMPVPTGWIQTGANTLTFRFNQTDGAVSGFRVLAFNVLDSGGNALISPGAFVYEDPNTWLPPSRNPTDIAAGQALWHQAVLSVPTSSGPSSIRAKCSDCHSQDGRDLKYFNYSNNSIRTRAVFHGLTAAQGDQIASYIRSLNAPNPGRPWNPPYQPGPGLDALPVEDWAAGAGIDAVLSSDAEMLPDLMPGGSAGNWASAAHLNQREVRIAYQLPDWNRWLPIIHPMDAFGDSFLTSQVNQDYQQIRSQLRYQDPVSYQNVAVLVQTWDTEMVKLVGPYELPAGDPAWNVPNYANKVYSAGLWSVVKNWEINQEFGLEGLPKAVFGANAEPRAWHSQTLFKASPNMLHIPAANIGIANGLPIIFTYFSQQWYELQLILNDGNGNFQGSSPLDFPYTYNFVGGMADSPDSGSAGLMLRWLVKGLQVSDTNVGPEFASAGWQPGVNDPSVLSHYPNAPRIWNGFTSAQRTAVLNGYLTAWINQISTFKPAQFWAGGWADPNVNPSLTNPNDIYWGSRVSGMIPPFLYWGADPAVIDRIISWASGVWPNFDWSKVRNATCHQDSQPWLSCTLAP